MLSLRNERTTTLDKSNGHFGSSDSERRMAKTQLVQGVKYAEYRIVFDKGVTVSSCGVCRKIYDNWGEIQRGQTKQTLVCTVKVVSHCLRVGGVEQYGTTRRLGYQRVTTVGDNCQEPSWSQV